MSTLVVRQAGARDMYRFARRELVIARQLVNVIQADTTIGRPYPSEGLALLCERLVIAERWRELARSARRQGYP